MRVADARWPRQQDWRFGQVRLPALLLSFSARSDFQDAQNWRHSPASLPLCGKEKDAKSTSLLEDVVIGNNAGARVGAAMGSIENGGTGRGQVGTEYVDFGDKAKSQPWNLVSNAGWVSLAAWEGAGVGGCGFGDQA